MQEKLLEAENAKLLEKVNVLICRDLIEQQTSTTIR